MWAVVVEVGLPRSDQLAGMAQAVEQMLIEAIVAHASTSMPPNLERHL